MRRAHTLNEGHRDDPHWRSRGYLPHFDDGSSTQFVTFRLADSLPESAIRRIEWELRTESETMAKASLRKRLDEYMDSGHGSCWLRDPRIADLVEGAILYFDEIRYRMNAWVVMPNHVHTLFEPVNGASVESIVHSWKSYTASQANRVLDRRGHFWSKESFDRYIRDARHFRDVVHSIHDNPVKAGLCKRPEEWLWSSASLNERRT